MIAIQGKLNSQIWTKLGELSYSQSVHFHIHTFTETRPGSRMPDIHRVFTVVVLPSPEGQKGHQIHSVQLVRATRTPAPLSHQAQFAILPNLACAESGLPGCAAPQSNAMHSFCSRRGDPLQPGAGGAISPTHSCSAPRNLTQPPSPSPLRSLKHRAISARLPCSGSPDLESQGSSHHSR
jgi:hypothetical protein